MRTGHKTLISMIESAEKRGQSKRGNWQVTYWKELKHSSIQFGYYRIYHWGTLVLEITETENHTRHTTEYAKSYVYGESVSDARGINAVLDYFGIGKKRYTYKPVNGGFMEVE